MSSLLRGTRLLLTSSLRRVTHRASSQCSQKLFKENLPCTSSAVTRSFVTDAVPEPVSPMEVTATRMNQPMERLSEVQRRLELMDSNVRWRGRIDREDVVAVLELAKKAESISDQQALMLLRCAGALMVKENPAKRMAIFKTTWDMLKAMGVVLKTSHYNAAIRIRLENNHPFVATDMLSEMERSEETKPNRVTFQLLVERYCQEGDVDGATTILQYMKTQNLPITEVVFNQLIVGHLKKGDVQGSKEVIESMRASGMQPSRETYKAILCCQAEKGNMDAMQETLSDAKREEVHISAGHLYAAVFALADNGHHDLIEQVLVDIGEGANHDALNTVHQLIARGHDDSAIQVYAKLNADRQPSDATHNGGRAILRTMLLNDRSFEKLQSTLATLKANGCLLDDGIDIIALMALSYEKTEVALAAFKMMKESELPVRPHFFWPVLLHYEKTKNTDGVCDTVALIVETAEQNEDYIPTLHKAFSPLLAHLKDTTAVVARLQEAGVTTGDVNTIQLLHLLNNGKLIEAQQFLDSDLEVTFHTDAIRRAFISAARVNSDPTAISKVAAQLEMRSTDGRGFFGGIVLNSVLSMRSIPKQVKIDTAQAWLDQSVPINSLSMEVAKNLLLVAGAPDSLLQELTNAAVPGSMRAMESREVRTMSVNKLEAELKTRRPNDRDVNTIRKHLLSKYCVAGDVKNADALRASLEEKDFVFDPPTLRQLSQLAAVHKKDLNEALMYKQRMEANDPEFHQYRQLVLNIATLQANKGLFNDAMETLVAYGKLHSEVDMSQRTESYKYMFLSEVGVLLSAFRAGASPADVRSLVDVLFKYSFTMPGMYSALVEVVNAYIAKGDMDGMMDVLKSYYHEFERIPVFQDVFRLLIAQKDAQKLEQVVDMVTNIQGSVDVLLKLAIACIDCQQTSKAAKIMATPGLRANMAVLKGGIDEYVRTGKERELRDLIDVTKDLFGVDREEMLFGIVKLCGAQKSAEGCQSALDFYDEQNVVPAPRTLRYIANVFNSQGKEVHFEVPAMVSREKKEEKSVKQQQATVIPVPVSNEVEERAVMAAQHGDLDDLLLIMNSNKTGTMSISTEILCTIARKLYKSRDGITFNKFLASLKEEQLWSIANDTNSNKVMTNRAKRELLMQYVTKKNDNPEKKASILAEVEADPVLLPIYFSSRTLLKTIRDADPQIFNKVVGLVEEQLKKSVQNPRAVQALFECYLENEDDTDAEQLLAKHVEFQKRVRMNLPAKILREAAKDSKDDARILWLLKLAKGISTRKTASVYSHLVALRMDADPQGALQAVTDARADGLEFTDLFAPTMRALEQKVVSEQGEVPWTPGLFAKK